MSPVKVCVTGSEGFVGAAVTRAIKEQHPEYLISRLDILEVVASGSLAVPAFIKADVRDYQQLAEVFDKIKPDIVVHTAGVVPKGAARYNGHGREAVRELNVKGTAHVLRASKAAKVKAVVYTSTVCVITDDYRHNYPNYDETVPYPKSSLTYGETKVRGPAPLHYKKERPIVTGRGRAVGAGCKWGRPPDLRTKTAGHLWRGRLPADTDRACMHRQRRIPLYDRRRRQPL